MRILMVAPEPVFTPRGTPSSVVQRIRALSKLGHRVHLVTYPFGEDPDVAGLTIHRARRPLGVNRVPVGPSVSKIRLDVPLFRDAYRLARTGEYDLLFTHEEAGIMGGWISRRCGLPHVYDMHSSLPEQFENFDRYDWPLVPAMFRRLERYTLNRADGVIVVCPALEDYLASMGHSGSVTLIENYYDPPPPATSDAEVEALRDGLDLVNTEPIVYTGTLEAYQGFDLLVEAATNLTSRATPARFVIVGGTLPQINTIRGMVSTRGLDDMFRFIPAVSPDKVWPFLRLASVLVTARNRGRNTPLKIYQYLRAEKPIVATAIESHTQVLDDTCAELVPVDPAGIAAGLERVLDDAERRRSLIAGARRVASERYRPERYLDLLGGLVSEVASEKRVSADGEPCVA